MYSLTTNASVRGTATISKALQVAGALLLGTIIVYGAGFVNTAGAHNAAHDMRHAAGFPCH